MLGALAAVGSPREVASDIAGRFKGQVDRVGFYTPYLMSEETLGEMMDAMTSGRAESAPNR
jgi:hypothetical protein